MSAFKVVLQSALVVYVAHLYIVDCEAECIKGQLDVLFLFDSSSTVGANDFRQSLQFASTLAENFHIGPDGVQFGASSFSDSPSNLFNLNAYSEFQNVEKDILGAQYLSGNTSTYLALDNAQTLFDQSRGGRAGAPKVLVVFTNGRSDDATRTQQQALRLKNSGVFVVVVGLSNSNSQELQAIASNSSVVFDINNFNGVLKFLQDYSNEPCSQPAECIKGQLDVLFLFDSSSTVGANDFSRGLQFASTLAENFHIGPDGVQFGAASFSDSPSNLFNLNAYSEFQNIEKAILGAQYLSGNTSTYLALDIAQTLFDQSRGGRAGARKVLVVFTNGRSDDTTRTQQQALRLKNSGVFVVVVGLSNSNNQELQAIASNSSVVFDINNFNGVLKYLQDYSNEPCSQPVKCAQGQLDILFLVDASSKVDVQQFNHELGVSANLAENFRIGSDAAQFSTVTYAESPHNLFDFNTYTNFSSLEAVFERADMAMYIEHIHTGHDWAAILQAQYLSGSTNTFLALESSRNVFFGSHGARSSATKVALLFSNGGSTDPARTQQEAAALRSYGVYVISVAVSNVADSELQAVSSSHGVVFQINDFDGILHALQGYVNTTCNQAPCMKGALDVLYVFDSSSTVTLGEFNNGLRFAANLAENFHIGAGGFQFGAISFAANSHRIFDFSTLTNYTDLEKAILNIAYQAGSTNTPLALQDSKNFFGDSQGARVGAPKVALVFTNGKSGDYAATAEQATALKQSGVYVIAVGYPGANRQELLSIASDQNSVFSIDDLSNVLKALLDYSNTACDRDQ